MARLRAYLHRYLHWRTLGVVTGYVLAVAVVVSPIAAEQAVENVRFSDRLGTVPVDVTLCHNGYSSLQTGLLGDVYWKRTGLLGFGACVRVTQPPEAGDTLSSYVDQRFVQTNVELVSEPGELAAAYGHQVAVSFRHEFLKAEALLLAIGLLVVIAIRRRGPMDDPDRLPWWGHRVARRLTPWPAVRVVLWPTLLVVVGLTASSAYAAHAFRDWPGTNSVGTTYGISALPELTFSSPQAREIASQVQPFIEKNTDRLRERAQAYEDKAAQTLETAVAARTVELAPREGEKIVIAEADPQGSSVGTAVRKRLYPILFDALGRDSFALRTIAGDITSNGTVAEDGFVKNEAHASGDLPTVAAKGDHDSARTVRQMEDHGIRVPDLETEDVDGLRVTVGNDPEFKTLFGGSVTNPSGVTEEELGKKVRKAVDPDQAGIVVMHQASAVAAYLGIGNLNELKELPGSMTEPYDDGIADVPPGTVDVGHSHTPFGPYVLWNTDTGTTTWTVVDRLGTSGGAENSPTFNRFSTPTSVPLKPIDVRLQFFDTATGLQTGYASLRVDLAGNATLSVRTDVGLPMDQVR